MVATQCLTFNHAPYIEEAFRGFTMQETNFPVVYLVVDDASTDGEQGVIKQYLADNFQMPFQLEETEFAHIMCATHKRNHNCQFVVYLLKFNHYRIKKAKLPYLSEWFDKAKYKAICEGDDYWTDSSKLQKQVDFLELHPDYSMCFHSAEIKCESEDVTDRRSHQYEGLQTREYKGEELIKKWIIPTASIVHRSFIQYPVDSRFLAGDILIRNQCSIEGKVFCFSEKMSVYRIHDGGMTLISPWKSIEKQLNHFEALIEHFPQYKPFYLQLLKKTLWHSLLSRNLIRTIQVILKRPVVVRYFF